MCTTWPGLHSYDVIESSSSLHLLRPIPENLAQQTTRRTDGLSVSKVTLVNAHQLVLPLESSEAYCPRRRGNPAFSAASSAAGLASCHSWYCCIRSWVHIVVQSAQNHNRTHWGKWSQNTCYTGGFSNTTWMWLIVFLKIAQFSINLYTLCGCLFHHWNKTTVSHYH